MDEYEFELRRQRWATVDVAVRNLTKWGPLVAIAFFGWKSVDSLAGRTTVAAVLGKLGLDLRLNKWASLTLAWILAGGSAGWAALERRLRYRTTERLAAENTRLERLLDAKRSSSRLTKRGTTSKGDEL